VPATGPRRPLEARRLLAAVLLLASACIADGRYHVRGVVRSGAPDHAPISGATASVRQCSPGKTAAEQRESATTGAGGEYEVSCWFGGMCFLFWCPGVGVPDTPVDFAAPGHRARAVRLLAKDPEPGVSRRPACDAPPHANCHRVDVTLEPEAAVTAA
jgi:hypothetical protein